MAGPSCPRHNETDRVRFGRVPLLGRDRVSLELGGLTGRPFLFRLNETEGDHECCGQDAAENRRVDDPGGHVCLIEGFVGAREQCLSRSPVSTAGFSAF